MEQIPVSPNPLVSLSTPKQPSGESRELVQDLEESLARETEAEVLFDQTSRALYATDASNYRQVPIGVVLPRTVDDLERIVAVCRRHQVPILPRGGGTGLAGQTCNVAVVMDTSKHLDRVLHIDHERRLAVFEPGIVLDRLQQAVRPYGLRFGPSPATHTHCTLGGMMGNNSCGAHSVRSGKTSENIERMEVLTYRGMRLSVGPTSDEEFSRIVAEGGDRAQLYLGLKGIAHTYGDEIRRRFPNIPRRVSGYNLPQLLPENGFNVAKALVGSEGTCVTILQATGRLETDPAYKALCVVGFPDVFIAADHIPQVLEHHPNAVEGMDATLIQDVKEKHMHPDTVRQLPKGNGWLLVEFGADTAGEAREQAWGLAKALRKEGADCRVVDRTEDMAKLWAVRESGLGATARVPGQDRDTWEGWEDSAVAPDKLGGYLRDFKKLLDQYGYIGALYGHFGDGCLHTRITFDLESKKGVHDYRQFVHDAADLVVSYGGSLSGEHGDGQSRGELLPKLFGPKIIRAFEEFKLLWDPDRMMNPGKVVFPYRVDENLRLGADFKPWKPGTYFHYPDDGNDFSRVATRCVGVGKCRKLDTGTMCPSYMVTRDERHSTRGRARAFFEMVEGETIDASWKNEQVKEALELCLACKACKAECPVSVDMATYKAEFLSHYYEGRLRPRAAYSMGLIRYWAKLASFAPRLVNTLGKTPGISNLVKALAGISQEREMPEFAEETFRDWFIRRPRPWDRHMLDPGEMRGGETHPSSNPSLRASSKSLEQQLLKPVSVPASDTSPAFQSASSPSYGALGSGSESSGSKNSGSEIPGALSSGSASSSSTSSAPTSSGTLSSESTGSGPRSSGSASSSSTGSAPTSSGSASSGSTDSGATNSGSKQGQSPPNGKAAVNPNGEVVLLWPDTFTNHFSPSIGRSAVEVLEAAGYTVAIPKKQLCCGRPLYDFGMLDLAKETLRETLDAIGPELRDGMKVVGLEPSCMATFHDELGKLFPKDEDAQRLQKQSYLFSDFINRYAPDLELVPLEGKAIVQGHCHQAAIFGLDQDKKALDRLGLEHETLDSGCCGMAGSFGFEEDKYEVSMKCAERVLLPRVERSQDAVVVAPGFSCREQIGQGSKRHAVHPAELMAAALKNGK